MGYASTSDMLERYDARIIGDLVADAGSRISSAALLTNDNLEAALDSAAGWIESAALVGNRYTAADLSGLTGNSLAFIKQLNCDIAFSLLRQRRGFDVAQFPAVEQSLAILDRIRLGERIFNVSEVKDKHNPTLGQPTIVEISNQNLVRDFAHRFYPVRRYVSGQ